MWAEVSTYQHVFNAKPSIGNNVTLSGVSWNITATNLGSYNSANYAGVQIGSSNNNGRITLTSSSAWGFQNKPIISEVRLWLNLGGTSVTPTVTIGGVSATSDGTTVVKNSSAGNDWTKATKVTFTPAANGNTGVVVIDVQTVKAGYICAVEIDCDASSVSAPSILPADGSTISGTQSVTINQAEGKDVYYTLDGSTPSSSSTKYIESFNVSASTITGEVTIKAIAIDGNTSSVVSSVTYTDPNIQPTLMTWNLNNVFLGVDENANLDGAFTSTIKGVDITIGKTSGTYPRGDATYIRLYANSYFRLKAPNGYNITQVRFTSPGTWVEPKVGGTTIVNKTWSGEEESVQFDFTGTSFASSVEITLTRALPYVVSFGDLNKTALVKGEEGTFSTIVTPASNSLVEGEDYEVTWSSNNDEGLTVIDDGTFEAVTRGAYKVTATGTALDNTTYRDATKEYDVTVTEKVVVMADNVVMAVGDAPEPITIVKTDGYAGNLTYVSGNTSIATVDASGNVTAVAKGTTTITISSSADAAHYFTAGDNVVINVTVKGQAELSYATTLYNVAYGAIFPTPTLTNPHNLPITYAKTGDNVATVDASTGAVTILSGTKGTARITASTVGNDEYAAGSAYYDIKVYDPDANDGSLAKPFTVEEANEWIAENQPYNDEPITSAENYYVRGIVSRSAVNGKDLEDGKQYFFMSDDGTDTNEIGVFYAKYLNNEAFSTTTWLMPGDEVVVCGPLQNYDGEQPYYVEISDNTYVVSITRRTFADGALPLEESFASSFGAFTNDETKVRKDENSTTYNVWTIDASNHYAKATSYVTFNNTDAESMLISPMVDATGATAESGLKLTFDQCINKYFGKNGTSTTNANIANEAMVYAKKMSETEWSKLTITYPSLGSSSFSDFENQVVDLSAYAGYKFQIAFVYRGTSTTAGTWEIKNVKIAEQNQSVNISTAQYASYCSPYKLDFSETDVKAYKASVNTETGNVTLTQVDVVPANEGVVLHCATAGTYSIPVTTAEASDVAGNEMVGVLARTQVLWNPSDGVYNYILQQGEFYKANDGYLRANRAYLSTSYDVSASGARSLKIGFAEETGISLTPALSEGEGVYFNLRGQRVQSPGKGLYIVNGRKVVIK